MWNLDLLGWGWDCVLPLLYDLEFAFGRGVDRGLDDKLINLLFVLDIPLNEVYKIQKASAAATTDVDVAS